MYLVLIKFKNEQTDKWYPWELMPESVPIKEKQAKELLAILHPFPEHFKAKIVKLVDVK